jgi:G3E family GTPase
MQPVFVTILGGFLGAGKTTLINCLLRQNKDEKIGIIENEFGKVNIDTSLISGAVNIVELTNGCICCSIRGELTTALRGLANKIDSGELAIDRFIIETTGLADPAPIIQTFFVDETIREKFVLDAVVTLADAKHIQNQLDNNRVAASQIGFADRIILTKADLIDDTQKAAVLERLNTINKKAQIWQANKGVLPKEKWIGINAFELNENLERQEGFYQAQKTNMKFTRFTLSKPTSYDDSINSFVLEGGELDFAKTDTFLEELIEVHGNDMLRYKGILAIKNEPNRFIVQGVHKVAGFDLGAAWGDDEHKSLIVIIGRDLPREEIQAKFLLCGDFAQAE